MQAVYNGIDMSIMQETYRHDMEDVLDDTGTDYLYTQNTFVFRSVVNGQADVFDGKFLGGQFVRNGPAITYAAGGAELGAGPPSGATASVRPATISDPVNPVYRNGVPVTPINAGVKFATPDPLFEVVPAPRLPTLTMQAIRQRLAMPRGQLFVFTPLGDVPDGVPNEGCAVFPLYMMSPEPGMVCDCKNGPFPKILSVDQVFGNDMTFVVTFAIVTYTNEGIRNGNRHAGVILSNRFTQTATTDEQSYTAITTEGKALFRTDYLYVQNLTPDHFRDGLMLKIPQGFVREGIEVTGLPDVTGIAYRFIDRQVPVSFPAGATVGAAKIVAVHRQAIVNNNEILQGALASYERVLGVAANANFAKPGSNKKAEVYSPPPAP